MKAPSFASVRPRSLPEEIAALEKHGEGVTLDMRFSAPEILAGLDDLRGISVNRNWIWRVHRVLTACLNRRSFARRPC